MKERAEVMTGFKSTCSNSKEGDVVKLRFRSMGTSRQRSGKGAIRKRFPLQKPRWEKNQTNNQALGIDMQDQAPGGRERKDNTRHYIS